MTDQSSVFGDSSSQTPDTTQTDQAATQQAEQQNNAPQTPAYDDHLRKIVNERGEQKYADVETALNALNHSQSYIQQLQAELDEAKRAREAEEQEQDRMSKVEESLQRLAESQQNNQPAPQEFQGLTEEQIDSLLKDRLSQHEQQKVSQANVERVSQAIRQQYGDKTQETVAQKAQAYGLSSQEFEQMAAKSPQMVLDIFGIKPHQNKSTVSSSTVNIPPVAPQSTELDPPQKSVMRGARTNDVVERMKQIREHVYNKHGITE